MTHLEKLPIRVLYVEDEEMIRQQTMRILSRFVNEVMVAANGQEGYDLFTQHHIDLIVSDIQMPVMSGLDMVKMIREQNKSIPIIIMTAHSDLEKLLDAIKFGVNDFLIKPIDIETLEDRIGKYSREISLSIKLKEQAIRFQAMLDFQDNMLILTDGFSILEANKSFTDFIGSKTMQSLRNNEIGVDDLFTGDNEYFIQKEQNHNWLEKLYTNQISYNMVQIKDKNSIVRTFMVKAKEFAMDKNQYVVSFVDATDYENDRKSLEVLANTDALTQIANRLSFTNILNEEVIKAKKNHAVFSVAMFDIDHFKNINDTYGHDAGDDALVNISNLAKTSIRSTDTLARWGGEEFMILYQNVPKEAALILCERLRKLIEDTKFNHINQITCSFGVTEYVLDEEKSALLKRVDEALYEAKHSGRNCCKVK